MPLYASNAPTNDQGSTSSAAVHGIVRVAALLGAVPLLREHGIDPAEVLLSLGLDRGTLDHADNRIHYRMAGQLIQRCAELTACPHFGLLVGQQATVQSLGTLGELMLKSPTVRSALRCLLLHLHLQTRGGVPTHSAEAPVATLGYAIYLRDLVGTAQAYDLVMSFEYNILQALCGPRWLPHEVSFSHAAPADLRPYRQFFRAPLRFDADRSEIRFDAAWLEQALPGFEATAHRSLQHELARQLMLAPDDCAEQVSRALRTMILSGRGSEAQISELMSLPQRSLRRALALQGTSFRAIVDEVRFEVARQLLADTDMTTNEIADALDYGDASAFTRAFRRWTDIPPGAWRARQRSGADAAARAGP
jgi:AraC-like DNA-binding protein